VMSPNAYGLRDTATFDERYSSLVSPATNPDLFSRFFTKGFIAVALVLVLCLLAVMTDSLLNLLVSPVQAPQTSNKNHIYGSVKYMESIGILPQAMEAGYVTVRTLTVPNAIAANMPPNEAVLHSYTPYMTQSDLFRALYP